METVRRFLKRCRQGLGGVLNWGDQIRVGETGMLETDFAVKLSVTGWREKEEGGISNGSTSLM